MGHGARAPTFTNGWARGHREQENSKQKTEQTVLTITKTLTKTTSCTFTAKKVEGHDQKNFQALGAGSVLPPHTFKFVPAPLREKAGTLVIFRAFLA